MQYRICLQIRKLLPYAEGLHENSVPQRNEACLLYFSTQFLLYDVGRIVHTPQTLLSSVQLFGMLIIIFISP